MNGRLLEGEGEVLMGVEGERKRNEILKWTVFGYHRSCWILESSSSSVSARRLGCWMRVLAMMRT